MKMSPYAALLVALAAVSCGGDAASPTAAPTPQAAASTSPASAPTQPIAPTPAPTPLPCTQGLCEDPTTNTSKPVRLTIRVYAVVNSAGELQLGFNDKSIFPVGYKVTIDATAKDLEGRDTLGSGNVKFLIQDDDGLVNVGGNHPYQRRLLVLKPGFVNVQAKLDGVDSNVLTLQLGE